MILQNTKQQQYFPSKSTIVQILVLANGYFVNRHSRLAKKFDFTFEFTADLNRRSIDDAFFVELPFTTKIAYLDTMPAL